MSTFWLSESVLKRNCRDITYFCRDVGHFIIARDINYAIYTLCEAVRLIKRGEVYLYIVMENDNQERGLRVVQADLEFIV